MFSHTCCMVSCIFPNSAVTIDWNISERGGRKQRRRFQIRHIKMGLCHVWRHSLKRVSSLTRHPTKLSKSMVYLESAYLPITDCRTLVLSWKPGEEKKKEKKRGHRCILVTRALYWREDNGRVALRSLAQKSLLFSGY